MNDKILPGKFSNYVDVIEFLCKTFKTKDLAWDIPLKYCVIATDLDERLDGIDPAQVKSIQDEFVRAEPIMDILQDQRDFSASEPCDAVSTLSLHGDHDYGVEDPEDGKKRDSGLNSFSLESLMALSKRELVQLVLGLKHTWTDEDFMKLVLGLHKPGAYEDIIPLKEFRNESDVEHLQSPTQSQSGKSDYTLCEWEIPYDELELGERIGAGSFGTVYKGQWHGTVAVKKLNVENPSKDELRAFQNEVLTLRKTRHRNCLLFMGASTQLPNLAIVTQWCPGLSLYSQIHTSRVALSRSHKLDISEQVAQGMEYLHSKKIIHRDLKSQNILLNRVYRAEDRFDSAPIAQIADFGLAMVKSKNVTGSGPAGSVIWMAPEIIVMKPGEDPYTTASDAYAFGIVLFEIFSMTLPYKGKQMEMIMYQVGRGKLRPDFHLLSTMTSMRSLVELATQSDPEGRPSFASMVLKIGEIMRKTPRLTRTMSMDPTGSRHRKLPRASFKPEPLKLGGFLKAPKIKGMGAPASPIPEAEHENGTFDLPAPRSPSTPIKNSPLPTPPVSEDVTRTPMTPSIAVMPDDSFMNGQFVPPPPLFDDNFSSLPLAPITPPSHRSPRSPRSPRHTLSRVEATSPIANIPYDNFTFENGR